MIGKIGMLLLAGFFALLIAGCAGHEVVKSTASRPPTTVDQVKIYQDYPAKYEDLGIISVTVTPEMKWDSEGDSPAAFEALLKAAAAKGANGVLLRMQPGTYDVQANAGYKGQFYIVNGKLGTPKTILANAIWVLKDKP